ncbi:dr1-associated corepressor isoform X3 [Pundamilia nyererei]|nr:PREDICTED: dr1-associated corepressor-like isoform X3 [Pundamilia nyererei]
MQKDAEVGRMAMAVPVIISRALEIFLKSLLTKTCVITESKLSAVVSVAHMKQCIESEKLFHFLKDLVAQTTPTSQKDNRSMRTNSMKFLLKNHLKWRKWLREVASTHLTTTRVPASRSSTSAYDCATSASFHYVSLHLSFVSAVLDLGHK